MNNISEFKRGLEQSQLNSVAQFFNTEIGNIILTNFEKFKFNICIRNNYINVYWMGRSLLKYVPGSKDNYSIHYKYTDQFEKSLKDKESVYTKLEMINEDLINPETGWHLSELLKKPEILKNDPARRRTFSDQKEREELSRFFSFRRRKILLIDLFIKINNDENNDKKSGIINSAFINIQDKKPILKFCSFELDTKHSQFMKEDKPDDYEIKARMDDYANFLGTQKQNLITSYRNIAENCISLGLMSNRSEEELSCLKKFIKNPIVDTKPFLQVLGEKDRLERSRKGFNVWRVLEQLFGDHLFEPFGI